MKKIIYIPLVVFIAWFAGCDQDIDHPYQGKERIQFRHYTTNYNGSRTYVDSLVFSFGMKTTDIEIDTAKIVIEYLGGVPETDKTYHVRVIPESTNAEAGKHYEAIPLAHTFRAGQLQDTLRIVVLRNHLNPSFANPEDKRIQLELLPSDDFDLGLTQGCKMKLLINNYLSEPDWWESNFFGYLNYYHPQKWRVLMTFHDGFKDQHTCSFNYNNEGRGYQTQLNSYLNNIVVRDEETGYRIYMTTMVPPED